MREVRLTLLLLLNMSFAKFLQYVRVNQNLLYALIGKSTVLDVLAGAQVAFVFRQLDNIVDVRICLDLRSHLSKHADFFDSRSLSHLLIPFRAVLLISETKLVCLMKLSLPLSTLMMDSRPPSVLLPSAVLDVPWLLLFKW